MSTEAAKKVLSKSFVDNHENVSEDEASELIIAALKQIREIEDERDEDPKLSGAKQVVKDLSSAYSSAIKYEKAKINFLVDKIKEIQSGEVNPSSGANS